MKRQPEKTDATVMPLEVGFSVELDDAGDGHGYGGENEADADALEVGDAVRVAGDAAEEGDEGEFVERNEEGHEEEWDDGDGG